MAEYLDKYREAIRSGDSESRIRLKSQYSITVKQDMEIRDEVMSSIIKDIILSGDFITLEDVYNFLKEGDQFDN